jgi:hypothetical protein
MASVPDPQQQIYFASSIKNQVYLRQDSQKVLQMQAVGWKILIC